MARTALAHTGTDVDADADATDHAATHPPGVIALTMLFGVAAPDVAKVLEAFYRHPADRAAMLAFLHRTAGNAYVQQVMTADAAGRGELAAATTTAAATSSGGETVPAPRTAGPGLTAFGELLARGTPDVDAVIKVLDAHPGERDLLVDAIGTYLGDAFLAQVREAMPGLRVHWRALHLVAGDPLGPGAFFDASKDRKGAAWRTPLFGGTFAGEVGGKVGYDVSARWDEDHYLEGSEALDGGRWKLGEFSGSFAGGKLDSAYAFTASDQLKLHYDTKAGFGTLGFYQDGELTGLELAGGSKDGGTSIGLQRGFGLGDGVTGMAGVRHQTFGGSPGGASGFDLSAGRSRDVATFDVDGKHHDLQSYAGTSGGEFTAGLSSQHQLGEATSLRTRVDQLGDRTSGGLGLDHRWSPSLTTGTSLEADGDRYKLGSTTRYAKGPWDASATAGMSGAWGDQPQYDVGLSERYRGQRLHHEASVSGRFGAEGSTMSMTGSLDADLGGGVYAGTWGKWTEGGAQDGVGEIGGSLTFLPHERAALTLAGVMSSDGRFDTRLQLDVFRSKIRDLNGLTSKKKDALISVFVGYGTDHLLDNRYGSPDYGMGLDQGGQLRVGVGWSF